MDSVCSSCVASSWRCACGSQTPCSDFWLRMRVKCSSTCGCGAGERVARVSAGRVLTRCGLGARPLFHEEVEEAGLVLVAPGHELCDFSQRLDHGVLESCKK